MNLHFITDSLVSVPSVDFCLTQYTGRPPKSEKGTLFLIVLVLRPTYCMAQNRGRYSGKSLWKEGRREGRKEGGEEGRLASQKRWWGDFPGGAVVKNLPANAGDTGSIPGPGRSHLPRSN